MSVNPSTPSDGYLRTIVAFIVRSLPAPLFALLASVVTLGGLVVVVAASRLVRRRFPQRSMHVAGILLGGYAVALILRPPGSALVDSAVMLGAVGGVLLLERGLHSAASVAVFMTVAAVVDLWSMGAGLTRTLLDRYREGASNLLLYLTLVVAVGGRAVPIVGIGDLVVGGAAATALLRIGVRPLGVAAAFAAGLLSALAYGLWRGGAPALPFVAIAVLVLVGWHQSRRQRSSPAAVEEA